jgi:hypothetical protein
VSAHPPIIVLLCPHASGGYLDALGVYSVVRCANAHAPALCASYYPSRHSCDATAVLECHYHQLAILGLLLKPSLGESLPWPHQRLAFGYWERFPSEQFEPDLALLVSLETRIGMSMLDSTTLKLAFVRSHDVKTSCAALEEFSGAIARFFWRRTSLAGLAFIITVIDREASVGSGESYDEGVLVVDTSCPMFLAKDISCYLQAELFGTGLKAMWKVQHCLGDCWSAPVAVAWLEKSHLYGSVARRM